MIAACSKDDTVNEVIEKNVEKTDTTINDTFKEVTFERDDLYQTIWKAKESNEGTPPYYYVGGILIFENDTTLWWYLDEKSIRKFDYHIVGRMLYINTDIEKWKGQWILTKKEKGRQLTLKSFVPHSRTVILERY